MILLLRGLARLVGVLLMALLALVGLAAAVFSIQGGESTLSLPQLASLLHLPELERSTGTLLRGLEANGPVAQASALAGVGAMVAGLALLAGVLVPRRERLVEIEDGDGGSLAARRSALRQVAVAQMEQSRECLRAKARVRPRRNGPGGRLQVTSFHAESISDNQAKEAARRQLSPLAESLHLRLRARAKTPRHGQRRVV